MSLTSQQAQQLRDHLSVVEEAQAFVPANCVGFMISARCVNPAGPGPGPGAGNSPAQPDVFVPSTDPNFAALLGAFQAALGNKISGAQQAIVNVHSAVATAAGITVSVAPPEPLFGQTGTTTPAPAVGV